MSNITEELAALPPEKREGFVKTFHLNPDGTFPDLHPDLAMWVGTTKFGWEVLKHPLVFAIPYTEAMNGLYNAQYEHKLECIEEYTQKENWHGYCVAHERPYRITALEDIEEYLDDEKYWDLLRWVWIDSENIWQNIGLWQKALNGFDGRHSLDLRSQHFMGEADRYALDHFSDTINVFRGTAATDRKGSGLSWTIDEACAIWFAQRFKNQGDRGDAVVLKGTVKKDKVVGFITDRNESEIVVASPRVVKVTETLVLK